MQRIERRLSGCSTMLSYDGRFQLLKSVFSSLPIFFMCTLALPFGVVEQINKYLRNFFWRKYGMADNGTALIAWSKVCKPKEQGGLGILDISMHNKALLMKNILKFLNREEIPWVKLIWEKYYSQSIAMDKVEGSFWWRAHLKLIQEFKTASTCTVSSGQSILFWKDNWTGDKLEQKFPELHSFAVRDTISVQEFCESESWIEQFHMPLSTQAYNQFLQLEDLIPSLDRHGKDIWTCNGLKNKFSSMLMYKHLMGNEEGHPIFNLIWKSSSRLRHKIFFWLVAHCRINTRSHLLRKGMHLHNPHCPNCNQKAEETALHLLWDCNFAQDCWSTLIPHKARGTSVYEETLLAATQLPKQFAIEIVILGCWNIWQQRNGKIFRGLQHSIHSWRFHLKQDLKLLQYKLKEKHFQGFKQWLDREF